MAVEGSSPGGALAQLTSRRLTGVDTDNGTACTRTTYGFDVNSNRTAKTTYPDDGTGNCQSTTGATIVATSYDAGDRAAVTGHQSI